MTNPRHTLGFLARRFTSAGIQPDARRGQNFLIDQNLMDILVDAAELCPHDLVLEVGTGTGSLTARLADRAGHVVTVEIDRRLWQLAREELIDRTNITMLVLDVLKNKNRIDPLVLETIADQYAKLPGGAFKLVANLPYNVATPLLSNFLLTQQPPHRMVVTIQNELADRIVARPSTKEYGSLSIWIQSFCQAEILRVLPPSVFWPRPQVRSAFVRIIPDLAKIAQHPDLAGYHRFIRSIFLLRRKFLRSVLISACKPALTKPDVDAILEHLALNAQVRAEELGIEQVACLYQAVQDRINARKDRNDAVY